MSLTFSYMSIAVAFLVVSAMAVEVVVRRRHSDQPSRWRGSRRIDPAATMPPAKTDVAGHRQGRLERSM